MNGEIEDFLADGCVHAPNATASVTPPCDPPSEVWRWRGRCASSGSTHPSAKKSDAQRPEPLRLSPMLMLMLMPAPMLTLMLMR